MSRLALALVLAVLAVAPAAASAEADARDGGADSVDVSKYPDVQKKNYALFQLRCSKCHTTARAINAKFNAQEWKRYMKRMVRRPNSNISEEEADQIYDFLKFYSDKQGL
jgi:hypothetical protein